MARVYSNVETFAVDAEISATLSSSTSCVRITLGDMVIRLDIEGAIDLIDSVVAVLAQLEPGDAA